MNNLIAYVMRGRVQAIWVALLFTLVPFLGWIADVIMALVTLRKGTKEGAIVLAWIALPGIILGVMGYPQILLYDLVGISIVTFILAVTLRHYGSWRMVLQIGMILGIVAVILSHIFVPDLSQIWAKYFAAYLQTVKQQSTFAFDIKGMQNNAGLVLKIATGLQVTLLLIVDFFILAVARWSQARLYNPGGIHQELQSVRLDNLTVAIFAGVILLSLIGWAPAIDSLPVVLLIFLLAGVSLVHGILVAMKKTTIWLVVFYLLLVLLFPYLGSLLIIAALVDCWFNLRNRVQVKNS